MKDRIKEVRKDNRLTQADFGERIGVKGNTIGNYELGLRNPTDAVILSICREFKINEEWLRTGNGNKYIFPKDETAAIVSELLKEKNPTYDIIRSIMKTYQKLDPKSQKAIDVFAEELLKELKGG